MTTRLLLAPSADLARKVLAENDVQLTVEAEYGSYVAEGRLYTAAHHQPAGTKYAGTHVGGERRSPCNDEAIPEVVDGTILLSHVDLDTFGGCLRAAYGTWGYLFVLHQPFWDLAEYVDTRGAHKLLGSGAAEEDLRALHAFWAWSKVNVPRLGRDAVTDVTDVVRTAGEALTSILVARSPEMLAAGDAYRAAEADLNRRTFVRRQGPVIVRRAAGRDFCNHLYSAPDGTPALAVAAYNSESGGVTVSLADATPGR